MGVKAFRPTHISIKEAVLPFNKFPQEDTVLAPEMKSTGEVMGIAESFGAAYAKAQWGASGRLPSGGCLFVSVKSVHKKAILPAVRSLLGLGFRVMATGGTHDFLAENGIASEMVYKVGEGRPDIVDRIKSGELDVIFNTPMDTQSRFDDKAIRREAVVRGIPCFTTVPGINACVEGIEALHHQAPSCRALQDYFPNRG
jgi:carbamoyl-phosphate synthase large subunit